MLIRHVEDHRQGATPEPHYGQTCVWGQVFVIPQPFHDDSLREKQLSFRSEIDVMGMRADEALQAVTYFIDDAIQFQQSPVRILHGTGTGALRQALRRYLDTVPGVVSYSDEDVRFGGAGITVVNLR